jgi:hypothetical protein
MTTINGNDMIDAYEGAEAYANDTTFHTWCEHLFFLNNKLYAQTRFDVYYLRAYFIVLYELSNNGLYYAKKQELSVPDKRYSLLVKMIEDIFSKITDDEYFLIKYYRDSYCHIFTRSYNYHDGEGRTRKNSNFYTKDGTKYILTPYEIMKKVESIIGRSYSGEVKFKERIFTTFYPIIKDYEPLFKDEKERISTSINELLNPFNNITIL